LEEISENGSEGSSGDEEDLFNLDFDKNHIKSKYVDIKLI
jgi:hypothetical protein